MLAENIVCATDSDGRRVSFSWAIGSSGERRGSSGVKRLALASALPPPLLLHDRSRLIRIFERYPIMFYGQLQSPATIITNAQRNASTEAMQQLYRVPPA